MTTTFKKLLLAVTCSSALLFTACGGDDNDFNFIRDKTFVSDAAYTQDGIEGAVIRVMTYKMPNVRDQKAEATAMVFFRPHLVRQMAGVWWSGNMEQWALPIIVHRVEIV